MITLKLQLVFESKPKKSHQEVTNYIIEYFPGDDVIAVASGPTKDGEVRLKLKQDKLTELQRDWLHLDTIARYIDSYDVEDHSPPKKPNAAVLQTQADIIENKILQAAGALRVMSVGLPYVNPNLDEADNCLGDALTALLALKKELGLHSKLSQE
jgi:hypothetical protein